MSRGGGRRTPLSRDYTVGLPVTVYVHEDGTVRYEIDTAEAGEAIRELAYNGFLAPGETIDTDRYAADAELVDADHDRRMSEDVSA